MHTVDAISNVSFFQFSSWVFTFLVFLYCFAVGVHFFQPFFNCEKNGDWTLSEKNLFRPVQCSRLIDLYCLIKFQTLFLHDFAQSENIFYYANNNLRQTSTSFRSEICKIFIENLNINYLIKTNYEYVQD